MFKADLPPLKPGDPATQPAQGRFLGSGGKVEVEVYQALGLHERVFVLVDVTPGSSDELPSDEVGASGRNSTHKVLFELTSEEFWLSSKTRSSVHGLVNIEGLKKLESHPNVKRVFLISMRYPVPKDMKKQP